MGYSYTLNPVLNYNKLLIIFISLFLGVILFYNRWIFSYRYDPVYYENLYYHSQWNITGSIRGISDGELYKFVGYRLVEGENPFNINFEVPPLGKYLYGLSEHLLGNPFYTSLGLYLATLFVLWKLSRLLFEDTRLSLFTLLLFVVTPFVGTQIGDTMLDLPLMFFLLLHLWFFTRYSKNKHWLTLMFSGGFLGLATGVKLGIYTPLLLLFGLIMTVWISKKWWHFFTFPFSLVGGYVLGWFCYFSRHPNPLPWIRLHEKPLRFYLDSGSTIDHWNQWHGIFANTYQGWWSGGGTTLGDWSPLLPFGVIATVIVFIWALKNRHQHWVYLSLFSITILTMNTFTPFFPRYLMSVIPAFVLLTVQLLRKKQWLIIVLVLLTLPFFKSSIISDDLPGHTQAVAHFLRSRAYKELHRSLPVSQQQEISRSDFIKAYEDFLDGLYTRSVTVQSGDLKRIGNAAESTYTISYHTRFGVLTHHPILKFEKIQEQWRLRWSWDYVWPNFQPGSLSPDLCNTLADQNFKAETTPEVWVIPRLMYDWNKHLNYLVDVTGVDMLEVNRRLRLSIPDEFPRYVGQLSPEKAGKIKENTLPGVYLRDPNIGFPQDCLKHQ